MSTPPHPNPPPPIPAPFIEAARRILGPPPEPTGIDIVFVPAPPPLPSDPSTLPPSFNPHQVPAHLAGPPSVTNTSPFAPTHSDLTRAGQEVGHDTADQLRHVPGGAADTVGNPFEHPSATQAVEETPPITFPITGPGGHPNPAQAIRQASIGMYEPARRNPLQLTHEEFLAQQAAGQLQVPSIVPPVDPNLPIMPVTHTYMPDYQAQYDHLVAGPDGIEVRENPHAPPNPLLYNAKGELIGPEGTRNSLAEAEELPYTPPGFPDAREWNGQRARHFQITPENDDQELLDGDMIHDPSLPAERVEGIISAMAPTTGKSNLRCPPEKKSREWHRLRRARAYFYRLRGLDADAVAIKLEEEGFGKPDCEAVAAMVRKHAADLARQMEEDTRALKMMAHDRLEGITRAAVEAWDTSRGTQETRTIVTGRAIVDRNGNVNELPDQVTVVENDSPGNPAFLTVALQATKDLRALHGLDAPKKTDLTSDGKAIKMYVGIDLDDV